MKHLKEVLNHPTLSMLFRPGNKPQRTQLNVTLDEITRTGVFRAIKRLKNNKVPGLNEVTAVGRLS